MVVDAELAVRFGLRRDLQLDDAAAANLRNEQSRFSARRRLVGWLALRRKSVGEARIYLRRLGYDEAAVEHALSAAHELQLLDDKRYSQAYVRSAERVSRKGPRAVRHELLARGVADEMAEQAIADSGLLSRQRETVRDLAAKRLQQDTSGDPLKTRRRIEAFLLRRGYDPEIVAEVLRELALQ